MLDASQMRYNNFTTVEDLEPLALEGVLLTIVPPGYQYDMDARRLVHDNDKLDDEQAEQSKAKSRGK